MSAALKLLAPTPSETHSERPNAPANDNVHLHLVVNKTVGPRALGMSYDSQNRLTSHTDNVGAGRSLGYDARGNVTQLGSLFFTYDMSDQPTYISGSANGTYRYDGNLKRVKSTVDGKIIYNVYDAGGSLIHIDAVTDGKQTDYIGKVARVTNSDEVDTITYLHADQLGSANTGSDDTGNVLWREQYTPFGITLTSPLVNNDLAGFTGHIKDSATGLNYMQARYYDPLVGRFLSTDPIGFSPQRPEMFGKYTYVGNDPISNIDPDGMCFASRIGSSGGSICGGIVKKIGAKADSALRSFTPQIQAAQQDPEGFQTGVAKGISNGGANAINGAVTLAEIANPSSRVGDIPDIPTFGQGSNPAENFGMAVGETGFNVGALVIAPEALIARGGAAGIKAASSTGDFFSGTVYSAKVRSQIKSGDFHSFPSSVHAFQGQGRVSTIIGGDGVAVQMLKIPGAYRGRTGNFEFIKSQSGLINHRYFNPN